MDMISKKTTMHPAIFVPLILLDMPYSALTCQKFYALLREWNHMISEGLALSWLLREPHLPAGSSSNVNSSGLESCCPLNARAKPEELLRQIKHGRYLIIDSPHLVFCSLTLPGILMMLFRIPGYFRWLDSKQCSEYKQRNIFPKQRLYWHIK